MFQLRRCKWKLLGRPLRKNPSEGSVLFSLHTWNKGMDQPLYKHKKTRTCYWVEREGKRGLSR
jgi:hypothetical protein